MSHYYDKHQSSERNEKEVVVSILGNEFSFVTASGLFSKDHLDIATYLLITSAQVPEGASLLDLGCGWGPVTTIFGFLRKDVSITAVDSSLRAIEYTKKNAKRYKVDASIFLSNVCEKVTGMFDVILTNPPYAAGRETCYAFIEQSFEKLNKNGSLQLVARHQKGGKMLQEKMEAVFGNVEVIAKKSGFRVYKSVKN